MISHIKFIIIIIIVSAAVIGLRSRLVVSRDRANTTPWLPGNPASHSTSSVVLQRDQSAVVVDSEHLLDDNSAANWLVATMVPWYVCTTIIHTFSCSHAALLNKN